MSFVTLNIFPNLHTHFSLIQSLSYCRNIYAFSFYPHSPNMNDVQNIVYLYFLHHAPFRETLHGSIYANNKWRNNSVTALNIPRIGVAYAPKPNEKAFICRHDICAPSRNTMPEQFPLYLNPQTNIHCKMLYINQGIIPPIDTILVFVPVCQQIRFHTLTFPPFRRSVLGRPPGR